MLHRGSTHRLVFLIVIVVIVIVAHLAAETHASSGDRSWDYIQCCQPCFSDCARQSDKPSSLSVLDSLNPLRWTCMDECRYNCMHACTEAHVAAGQPVQQFHGKWPFTRFAGMQEPASVLFSILNGMAHIYGARRYAQAIPEQYAFRRLWIGYAVVNVNTWFWSAIYHTRDLFWTERLDYWFATASILCSMFCGLVRISNVLHRFRWLVMALMMAVFGAHVIYLSQDRFDYGYNMTASVAVFAANAMLWVLWCAFAPVHPLLPVVEPRPLQIDPQRAIDGGSYPPIPSLAYRRKALAAVVGLGLCAAFEIADFPPVFGIFDAHALWHGSTVLVIVVWYSFLIDDASYELHLARSRSAKQLR
ncbi:post-GPI attachment to protein factor 3 [Capsaspora owczarzaki ATCC 30864]|uniref:Post-GPI attachment to proteins factor 3 n=1 Tax=Capsaspora owczarzaki (strain ATCC 30864) TaxID=595528 RepID=A0A0D2VLL9_CAPO3|nr:post-GPI attachment to protein factor 3 [Capsaspora owczarzaki ATCC 30864]KJE91022.1 post-GPI attachment to protein factor 3 [Capsaspora owczarzaki ATCC 30864]|eukprot:XP_004348976.1 post-GPI attachment to protein factor 3 [Capsaspora owczarzaki ATCC 30864]